MWPIFEEDLVERAMWYLFGQDYHGRVGYSHLQTPTRVEKETDAGRNLIQHTLPVTSRKIMTTRLRSSMRQQMRTTSRLRMKNLWSWRLRTVTLKCNFGTRSGWEARRAICGRGAENRRFFSTTSVRGVARELVQLNMWSNLGS